MPENEKQEGKKTVVAFITGLLIGGLLVWVFSSTPDSTPEIEDEDITTEESADEGDDTEENDQGASVVNATRDTDDESNGSQSGEGSISITNQAAGNTVQLGDIEYPEESGWVVIRDYSNGTAGRILGAARYNTEVGLAPTSVQLLRSTVAGNTYQAVFYSENGDMRFATANDRLLEGGATATFTAE